MRKPDYQREDISLYCGDCLELLPQMEAGSVDAVVTDPPFSDRTHKGHNLSANGHLGEGFDSANRVVLGYEPWTESDVATAIPHICRVSSGWIAVMTDHILACLIQKQMEREGRYAFAPLPFYAPGSRCRLSGDGPSSWTVWIVVSRTEKQVRWGTLPGGYTPKLGWRDSQFIGGKPTALMSALIRDYSRDGDVILDPYLGSGTTAIACLQSGRRCIGIEQNRATFDIAVNRIEAEFDRTSLLDGHWKERA